MQWTAIILILYLMSFENVYTHVITIEIRKIPSFLKHSLVLLTKQTIPSCQTPRKPNVLCSSLFPKFLTCNLQWPQPPSILYFIAIAWTHWTLFGFPSRHPTFEKELLVKKSMYKDNTLHLFPFLKDSPENSNYMDFVLFSHF